MIKGHWNKGPWWMARRNEAPLLRLRLCHSASPLPTGRSEVVLDTSATASLACFEWLRIHNGLLKNAGHQAAAPYPALARFKFGSGCAHCASWPNGGFGNVFGPPGHSGVNEQRRREPLGGSGPESGSSRIQLELMLWSHWVDQNQLQRTVGLCTEPTASS